MTFKSVIVTDSKLDDVLKVESSALWQSRVNIDKKSALERTSLLGTLSRPGMTKFAFKNSIGHGVSSSSLT